MRRSHRRTYLLAGVLALALVPGCGGDGYSDAVIYELRQDPILTGSPEKIAPQGYPFARKADPPGQLPLMRMAGAKDLRNPFNREYFMLKDDPKLSAEKNKADREEQIKKYDALFIDPTLLSGKNKDILKKKLDQMYGSPAKPRVNIPGVSGAVIEELKLDRTSLAMGSKLYRLHCLTCHGVPGDGRGPTAQWVNPHPRDYRAGLFKFQSVDQTKTQDKLKPTRADLLRTLTYGIEGTSMPAFNLLTADELESLTSYVMHLSIRGETEQQTLVTLNLDPAGFVKAELDPGLIDVLAGKIMASWKTSQSLLIKPAPYTYKHGEEALKQSILRGQALIRQDMGQLQKMFPKDVFVAKYPARFGGKQTTDVPDKDYQDKLKALSTSVNCVTCHQDFGRQSDFKFDDWGTLVRPANWTLPVYRGGRRPVDLYYRIHSGIPGSGMTAFGKDDGLSGEQIWDIVNFLQVIPYPAMRQEFGVEID